MQAVYLDEIWNSVLVPYNDTYTAKGSAFVSRLRISVCLCVYILLLQ